MTYLVKKIVFIFLTVLSFSTYGQLITISGQVKNQSTGYGIPNKVVLIKSYYNIGTSSGMNYYCTAFTDNQGYYLDSVVIPSGQNIKFLISTTDCNNNIILDSLYTQSIHSVDFTICQNSPLICRADFNAYPDTIYGKKFVFLDRSTSNVSIWKWKFGDGDSSSIQAPQHIYQNNGKYKVCLTTKDPVSGCTSTYCDTVYVGIPTNCINNISSGINGLTVNLQAKVNSSYPTFYKWNFGDTTFGTGKLVTHTYSQAGSYTISLQTTVIYPPTYTPCISISSKTINLNVSSSANIFGQITTTSSIIPVENGMVYLYKYIGNKYQLLDSTIIKRDSANSISYYLFPNKPYGKYFTKAVLNSTSSLYNQYAPTYCENTYQWNQANAFQHNGPGVNNSIILADIIPNFGSASISGKVFEGYYKQPGDPIPNMLLYLVDDYGDLRGYTYTSSNGSYVFNGLGFNNFEIYADAVNKTIIPLPVIVNLSNPNVVNANLFVNSNFVSGLIEEEIFVSNLYPNPAQDFINIAFKSENKNIFRLSLVNSLNVCVLESEIQLEQIGDTYKLELSNIPSGIYVLNIIDYSGNLFSKKVVIIK